MMENFGFVIILSFFLTLQMSQDLLEAPLGLERVLLGGLLVSNCSQQMMTQHLSNRVKTVS